MNNPIIWTISKTTTTDTASFSVGRVISGPDTCDEYEYLREGGVVEVIEISALRKCEAELAAARAENEELMKADYWQDRHNIVVKELAAVKAELDRTDLFVNVLRTEIAAVKAELESMKHCYRLLDEERERVVSENEKLKAEGVAAHPFYYREWEKIKAREAKLVEALKYYAGFDIENERAREALGEWEKK